MTTVPADACCCKQSTGDKPGRQVGRPRTVGDKGKQQTADKNPLLSRVVTTLAPSPTDPTHLAGGCANACTTTSPAGPAVLETCTVNVALVEPSVAMVVVSGVACKEMLDKVRPKPNGYSTLVLDGSRYRYLNTDSGSRQRPSTNHQSDW